MDARVKPAHDNSWKRSRRSGYFVTMRCGVVGLCAAGEIENVSHAFQPSGGTPDSIVNGRQVSGPAGCGLFAGVGKMSRSPHSVTAAMSQGEHVTIRLGRDQAAAQAGAAAPDAAPGFGNSLSRLW